MRAVSEERQEIWSVVFGVQADLSLVVFLAFVVVPLEQLMEILWWGGEWRAVKSVLNSIFESQCD